MLQPPPKDFVKTLIISKDIHLLIALSTPSVKVKSEMNTMFYKFLWDEKQDKMRRSLAKQKIIDGVIGILDVT